MSLYDAVAIGSGSGTAAGARISIESLLGREALTATAAELDSLDDDLGVPLTARVRWAAAAFEATPDVEPWTIVARGPCDRPAAALVLAERRTVGGLEIGNPRPDSDDRLCSRARTPPAAEAVARVLADRLAATRTAWTVRLSGLSPNDPLIAALGRALPRARVEAGRNVPALRREAGESDVRCYLRNDVRRSVRRAHRRLHEDGVRAAIDLERHGDRIAAQLPSLLAAHRARDHDTGRASDLDHPSAAAFWRAAIEQQAALGGVELFTLRLDGSLAAYVLAFPEPPAYRVFDGHLVSRWRRYAPGRLLEATVMSRVLTDPSFDHVDWMSSGAPEKLIAANAAERFVTVVARGARAPLGRLIADRHAPDRTPALPSPVGR